MTQRKYRIAHFFCGIGGKGLGAASAIASYGNHEATFETIGGIDFDPLACKDFEMLVGAPALCADVHELQPADVIRFLGPVAPDVIMMSPPCKGFSGLLSAKRAKEPKYERMNQLMIRALFLIAETWKTPPKLIFVENVPRISSRGKEVVRQSRALLEAAGYAVVEGTHDCGELGGLAQHRRRYFMLARHRGQMPQVVYEPVKHRVRACGEVLGPMPMPGDVDLAGPMHSVPNLSWKNWVRLALIPAGGDWRDLPGVLLDGEKRREKFRRAPVTPWNETAETVTGPGGSSSTNVADPRIADAVALANNPGRHWNKFAVTEWTAPAQTVTGTDTRVGSGAPSVADPRAQQWFPNVYRVGRWEDPAGTVTGSGKPSSGQFSVADPRFGNVERVTPWEEPVGTITRSPAPSSGAAAVADPRWGGGRFGVNGWNEATGAIAGESLPNNGKYSVADPRFADGKKKNWQQVAGVTPWTEAAPTVISGAKIHAGAFQVADPRIHCRPRAGAYRVLRWDEAAATITGSLAVDNGAAAIADPRLRPDRPPPFTPLIIAADNTWHRPLTTLELAVLQSFPAMIDGKPLKLAGDSHTRWREAIGNAVPPLAALHIAAQLLRALLISALGAFEMSNNPVWVGPHRMAYVA